MALSNPYQEATTPLQQRCPGHVGKPLPSVQVRLVDETTHEVLKVMDNSSNYLQNGNGKNDNVSGALQVKGPTVFAGGYWNRPDATESAFTSDGWFDTGDVAEYSATLDSFRILGRASVDILKVGGYKLSALEIERELLEHPDLVEVYVVGVQGECE
jgi:malonyl-CoA/methylmalonyl-CoA synthetase